MKIVPIYMFTLRNRAQAGIAFEVMDQGFNAMTGNES
jgi:hypothetical protein